MRKGAHSAIEIMNTFCDLSTFIAHFLTAEHQLVFLSTFIKVVLKRLFEENQDQSVVLTCKCFFIYIFDLFSGLKIARRTLKFLLRNWLDEIRSSVNVDILKLAIKYLSIMVKENEEEWLNRIHKIIRET